MQLLFIVLRYGRNTSPESLFIFGVIVIIGFIYRAFFNERAVMRRKLRKAPTKKIGEVRTNDVVKIVGEVMFAGRTVHAGLSGRECSFYDIVVEERISSGKHSTWVSVIREKKRGDIVLKDETGYAVIQDDRAQAVLLNDISYTSGWLDDPLPEMVAFLKKHRKDHVHWTGSNKRMRYYEGALEEGELCAASGRGVWMSASKLNLKLPVDKVLVIRKAPNVETMISDHPEVFEESILP